MTEPVRGTTPSQTVGPYLAIALPWPDGPDVVPPGTPDAITISGRLYDGAGGPIPDGLVETWQAGPSGHCPDAGFRGFGRCPTDADGRWHVTTLRPGALGDGQAPHVDVSVFARGLQHRVVTRIYLPDEPANATDPVLAALDPADRDRLTATAGPDGTLRFDIRLQGEGETPFFEL